MRKSVTSPRFPPIKIVAAVNKIRDGVIKLQQKMVPPHVAMLEMITGMWVTQAIGVVAVLGVADHVTEEGTAAATLAQMTNSHPEALYRLLRALSSIGIFRELGDRKFGMTAMAECLKTDHPNCIRHLAVFQTQVNWEHWAELEYCVIHGKDAIEKLYGEKHFEHWAKHPEKAEILDRAMTDMSRMECEAILAAYDFSGFETVADIGAGHGGFLSEVLKTQSRAKGLLFDLPHALEGARSFLREEGLEGRVRVETGSFFDSIPSGADAYLMKHIIHNWSDDEARTIIRNIRKVIPATGKLLLIERLIADRNFPHSSKFVDLEMLVLSSGKERTKEEYAKLLSETGFRLERIIPTVSPANVIEAVPV